MKILLVEDNPVDRMFVKHSLRQVKEFKYELVLCESLTEAMEQLLATQFDVILLDLWLPDSEGLETCHRVVSVAHNVPVIVMTATDDRALATDAIRSGAQDYLVKGAFPGSAIARVLQYAIDRYAFQQELASRENKFQQVLNHVPAIIWTTDREMKITGAMGADLRLLHIDPQQIVGKALEEYVRSTGYGDETITSHQQAVEGGSVAFETQWQGRNFEIKVDPLNEPERGIVGTIGVLLDVPQRRALDHELHFAHLMQEALLPINHPQLAGFDIYGGACPASQTCGDWFDYLMFSDGSLGLVVGDVSGHGFGPAILSATVAAYLEVLAESSSDV